MLARPIRLLLAVGLMVSGPWAAEAQRGGGAPIQGANAVSNGDYQAPGALNMPMPLAAPSGPVDPNHKLQPGDILSFRISEDREPAPTQLAVTHSGDLLVEPLDHAVHVSGMTTQQASAEIKRQLEKDYYYNATVQLNLDRVNVAGSIGYVYFTGAVNRVGALPVYADRPMKLSEAIVSVGGFGRFADKRKVQVTRAEPGGTKTYITDMKAVMEEGKLDKDMEVKDGDAVFVRETFFKPN